jgi:hypothetical protein
VFSPARTCATGVTLALALGLHPDAVSAQQSSGFGLLLGANAATFTDIDVGSADLFNGTSELTRRLGAAAGAYYRKPLGGLWSLQPELYYSQRGSKLEFGGTGRVDGTLAVKLDYIDAGLMVRADLGSSGFHPVLVVGPTAGMRVGCKAALEGSAASLSVKCDEFDNDGTASDPFETLDVGVLGGVGLTGPLLGRTVTATARYSRGVTTVTSASTADTQPKNSVIAFVIAIGR